MTEHNTINAENTRKANSVVEATVTDWVGNELFSSTDYWEALDKYFELEAEDVQLNAYTADGTNLGIFY